jgi:hypothetical protein
LTPNGKLDRKALPVPGEARPALNTALVPPRTELERMLTEIWRKLLHVQEIGIDDNFFELGGNSIQAALVVNKLQHSLGSALSPAALFEAPTVASFSRYLTEHYPDATWSIGPATAVGSKSVPHPPAAADQSELAHPRGLESPGDVRTAGGGGDLPALARTENPEALLAELDQLSDEQVEALLRTMKLQGSSR